MKALILFLLCFIVNVISAKENYQFRHLTVHDGLADNEVIDILKDHEGFLWCVTNSAINRFDGYNVKPYLKTESGLDLSVSVQQILIDKENHIWIERYGYYFVYDRVKDQFVNAQPLLEQYKLHSNSFPQKIMIDDQKNIWSYNGKVMKVYLPQNHQTYTLKNLPEKLSFFYARQNRFFYIDKDNQLHITDLFNQKTYAILPLNKVLKTGQHLNYKLFVDSDFDIWIYSSNAEGLWLLTQQPNDVWKLSSVGKTSLLLKNKVINICEDNSHQIWIGLEYDGISIYNKQKQEYTHITQDATPYSLGSNKVWCFYCDAENTMWVGTMRNGISYYNPHFFSFPKITVPSVYDISCQMEDEAHNLWIGTDGDGIYKIDSEGHITAFKKELHNSFSNKITCMYIDSNKRLWIGTYLDGFGYYQDGKFHSQPFSTQFPRNPVNNSIWSITGDNNGNLYLGNLKCGLHVFNPRTGYFHTFTPQNSGISDVHVMNVYFDQKKSLYMATCNGTCILNTENQHITTLRHNKKQTQYIQDSIQNNVYIDSRNLLWIGGREGLTIFDMRHDSIYFLNKKHRLEGNFVRGITEDNNQNIWVVTTDGITRIETRVDNNGRGYAFHCFPYSKNDGLQTSDFVHNSIYKTQNGHILTGGNGGYYDIDPNIKYNKNISKVVFTELKVLGKIVDVDSLYNRQRILTRNIELTNHITLKHNQNTFRISFSTLEFIRIHDIRFSYRIKGTHDQWIPLEDNYITFNNMAPGKYELEIKAINSGGLWSTPTTLQIEIEPPIWLNIYAKIFYVLLILLFLSYIWYRKEQKHKRKMKYKEIEFEAKKQHEVDEMRLNFFTNLSHDFRTPLSLIIAPLEEVLKKYKNEDFTPNLNIVHKNALALLHLVNQILDFRKIGAQEMRLQLENGNYIQFIEDVLKHFSIYADTHQISITFEKGIDSLAMQFDKEKMHKIFMNLLSNAVKYTGNPGQITVKVWMENEKVFTSIADNGKGIPDSEKAKVFDAFYQLPNRSMSYGSGIGLHIVKELLILHHGSIHIEDNIPTGARFIFSIPAVPVSEEIKNESETQVENEETVSAQTIENEKNLTQTTLLIVEDNQDLRLFLSDSLKKEYQVFTAVDGLHALSILKKESIDMVITDVMMPNMDGLELCRAIKNDIKISHIPVIMLSAKDDIEYITAGLTEGADDYIAKPFNLDILKLRINKILHWKQDCHKKFSVSDIPVSDITSSSLDESFIQKVIKTVEENIESPQFSVEELSSIIGMSRSNLYNKLMSITGSSPSEFIRIIRLKKSLQLLEKTQMTVAEVAYRVGFNAPKIFTHYFKEEYKMTPTEYRKKKEDTQGHCEESAS
ncbi:hybrid sensor histidine kinase/response regulator transcription factor [Bacteroides mediterraneensis]|uniref:hybrid sensor histidine kinase/response regulator transcription factor n=1 Tax=Bacteroides mediterraneensis TaxID=1841856 RepID=UPI0026F06937|nr:hybrid sensor histidine kinase/response regulator transcription factor [Bacteroides mediterraneensis]